MQLTEPELLHRAGEWTHAGERLLVVSTQLDRTGRREQVTSEIALIDPRDPKATRKIASLPGAWGNFRFSPDDRKLLMLHFKSNVTSELWLMDLASGERTLLLPKSPSPAEVVYSGPAFTPDGRAAILTSNEASEFSQLVQLRVRDGRRHGPEP